MRRRLPRRLLRAGLTVLLRALPHADLSGVAVAGYEALLDDDERARARRFRSASDARAYVCAHGLLRLTLTAVRPDVAPADWRFVVDARGKPRVEEKYGEAPPCFSLTHAQALVACAVSIAHDVGVDAESLDRRVSPLPLARRFFTALEADALAALPDDDARRRAFIRLWTLKEAVVKATGNGIAGSLQGFSFSLSDPPAATLHDPALGPPQQWAFRRWDVAGCSVALALQGALAPKIHIDFQTVKTPP